MNSQNLSIYALLLTANQLLLFLAVWTAYIVAEGLSIHLPLLNAP